MIQFMLGDSWGGLQAWLALAGGALGACRLREEASAGYPDQSLHDIRLVIGTPGRRQREDVVGGAESKSRVSR
ncbi:hypothetical protein [Novilysobacter antarcticus]|uniref:hypothetical protein n=1 Tax=Novilysobacter antarcticus TaxID=2862543 RepID=UPI001C994380|nr:hypothetical protein [Lysobacter antarcticus]